MHTGVHVSMSCAHTCSSWETSVSVLMPRRDSAAYSTTEKRSIAFLLFLAFLSRYTSKTLWPGVLFSTTQYQWSKSINFSVHILPCGKGRRQENQGNGSSTKEPTSTFHRDMNSETMELLMDSKREQRTGLDAYGELVCHSYQLSQIQNKISAWQSKLLNSWGWLGLMRTSFSLSVFLSHRFWLAKLPSINTKIPNRILLGVSQVMLSNYLVVNTNS